MNVKWITFNDKHILYADYRGLSSEEMIKQAEKEIEMIMEAKNKILYLGNFEDTFIDIQFMKKVTELGKISEHLNEKSAIVGVSGMKVMLLQTYNLITGGNVKAFENEEEALKYLCN